MVAEDDDADEPYLRVGTQGAREGTDDDVVQGLARSQQKPALNRLVGDLDQRTAGWDVSR